MSVESSVPRLPAPGLPTPPLPPPGAVAVIPTLPAAPARAKPNWKPVQRSKARKALNGVIGIAVFAALAVGAWFVYQSLAPADDTTTPTTLLIDNPDTFVGQANAVVNQINAQAPNQEVLDLVGVESPESPPAPDAPSATTP